MESQTEQNAASLQILLPEKPLELQLWLVDELTILAEAIGEVVTTERLRIYAKDLAIDLSRNQLQIALTRARRESRFFPKIAEIRAFVGGPPEDQTKVEGEAAWVFANDYLRTWGVQRLPVYRGGNEWKHRRCRRVSNTRFAGLAVSVG